MSVYSPSHISHGALRRRCSRLCKAVPIRPWGRFPFLLIGRNVSSLAYSRAARAVVAFCFLLSTTAARATNYEALTAYDKPMAGGAEYISGDLPKSVLMRVRVIGAVPLAGAHYVPKGTDLLMMMSYVGGITPVAEGSIHIKRPIQNRFKLFEVGFEDLLTSEELNVPELKQDDIIIVPFKKEAISDNTVRIVGFLASILSLGISAFILADRLR